MKRCELLINVMNLRHNQTAAAAAGASSNGTHYHSISLINFIQCLSTPFEALLPQKNFASQCALFISIQYKQHTLIRTHADASTQEFVWKLRLCGLSPSSQI